MEINQPSRCPFEHIKNPDQEAEQIADNTEITLRLHDKRYSLVDDTLKYLSDNYPPLFGTFKGVHPKSYGCVQARFIVSQDIALKMQVGLFAEPSSQFDDFTRFSNAAALVDPYIVSKWRSALDIL